MNIKSILKQSQSARATADIVDFQTLTDYVPKEIKYSIDANPRILIQAPPGYLIASCDYQSQELYTAAAVSQDPVMLRCFSDEIPSKIDVPSDYAGDYLEDENLGDNPEKDPHTLAGKQAYSKYFIDKPKYEWCCIARNTKVAGDKSIRAIGKIVMYGAAYMQSAQAMSDTHHVPLKETKQWLKGFEQGFPRFNEWKTLQARLGTARGWARDSVGRIRGVNESNSKGADNSSDRLAVNHMIQALCATQSKLACVKLLGRLKDTPARIIGVIHDEVLVEVPGSYTVPNEAIDSVTGLIDHKKIQVSEEAKEYTQIIVECMEEAQAYTFSKIASELNLKGKASSALAPYWKH